MTSRSEGDGVYIIVTACNIGEGRLKEVWHYICGKAQ